MISSHGYPLNEVGGNIYVDPRIHPEIAAAAVSPTEAVLQRDGKTTIAPMKDINTDATELACNLDGCVLIPDDNNPHNDIHPPHSFEDYPGDGYPVDGYPVDDFPVEGYHEDGYPVEGYHEDGYLVDSHPADSHPIDLTLQDYHDNQTVPVPEFGQPVPEFGQSSHGIALNEVGGYGEVALGTDPELAAAAISSSEALI